MLLRVAGGLCEKLFEGLVQLRLCSMSLFHSEKQIDGGVAAVAEDGHHSPHSEWLSWHNSDSMLLVETFLSPSLGPSPESQAGSARQDRARFLQSWLPSLLCYSIILPCLFWSCWELGLIRGSPSVLSDSAEEGSKLWADVQSPPFPQGAGSVSHPCPRQGLLLGWLHPSSSGTTLFLCPSCFPDRGHCSQHSLMGAAAPNPPALPYCVLGSVGSHHAQAEPAGLAQTQWGCSQGTSSASAGTSV